MDAIKLDDYRLGGYYIGAYTSRPDNKECYLPEKIVSISDCRGDILRVSTLRQYDEKQAVYLAKQGVPQNRQEVAHCWYADNWRKEISFPDGFYTLPTAQQFASDFIEIGIDHLILGIGLHKSFADEFITGSDLFRSNPKQDKYFHDRELNRTEPIGANKIIRAHQKLEVGGRILGFDLVTYDWLFGCSYLCTCDQFDMVDKFNVYPNAYGLIDSSEIAAEVRKWRGSDDDYFPWLIVQYPIM